MQKQFKKGKPWSKLSRKEARSRRGKGYRVEADTVKMFKEKFGVFGIRITSPQQRGELRHCDFILCLNPIFGQAKYKKQYYTKEIDDGLRYLADKYNGPFTILSWRDNGIKWSMPYMKSLK